jgi:hypothetical protein
LPASIAAFGRGGVVLEALSSAQPRGALPIVVAQTGFITLEALRWLDDVKAGARA